MVGAGFAGLAAAIECRRQGHSVVVLEKAAELRPLGDIISFGSNAGVVFGRWRGVPERLRALSLHEESFTIRSGRTGEVLYDQPWTDEENSWGGPRYDGHRAEFHDVVYRHALACGAEVRLGTRVEDYFEENDDRDRRGGRAGVVLAGGARLEADVVLAAEGVRSRGRKIVLGFEDRPKPSGYAVYRSWFLADGIARDPDLRWLVTGGDKHIAWLGRDVHFIIASLKQGRDFSWVCTHKVRPSSPLTTCHHVARVWPLGVWGANWQRG